MDRERERTEGERRKQDVLLSLAARSERYVNRGRRALLARLLANGEATADDVRRAVELPTTRLADCAKSILPSAWRGTPRRKSPCGRVT